MIDPVALVIGVVQLGLTVSLIVLVGMVLFRQGSVDSKASEILLHAKAIRGLEEAEMAELDDLTAEVQAAVAGEDRAIALLNGLAAKIDAAVAANNPAALVALSDALKDKTAELAAAMAADARP